MKFKHKIIFLLMLSIICIIGTLATVFAEPKSSDNTITRIDIVNIDEMTRNVNLKIVPHNEVLSGSSIILEVNNGEFRDGSYYSCYYDYNGKLTYSEVIAQINAYCDGSVNSETYNEAVEYVLSQAMYADELPFKMRYINSHTLQIDLAPITQNAVDNNIVSNDKPYYLIPIGAVATGDTGEDYVTIDIDGNGSSISDSSKLKIANCGTIKPYTTAEVNSIAKGISEINIDTIEVKEGVKGTFESGTVIVRLGDGFEINTEKSNITISAGLNLTDLEFTPEIDTNKKWFRFNLPAAWSYTHLRSSFVINGIVVDAIDKDNDWGDINIFIKGDQAGISRQVVKIAERINPNAVTSSETTTEATTETTTEITTKQTSGSIAKVYKINKDDYSVNIDTICVKEAAANTFKNKTVTLRLNEGFEFSNNYADISPGQNILDSEKIRVNNIKNNYFTFDIPTSWTGGDKCCSFNIDCLSVEPKDPDSNWGDINITISGETAGITEQTIKVGERIKKGTVTTIEDTYTFLDEYEYEMYIPKICIKEVLYDSLKQGKIKAELNDGFVISDYSECYYSTILGDYAFDSGQITIDLDKKGFSFKVPDFSQSRKYPDIVKIYIHGLVLIPENRETNYGDILLTVSGDSAGVTNETVKIGTRIKKNQLVSKKGDINADGLVNNEDASFLLKYLCGTQELSDKQMELAKVTNDDALNMLDVIKILQIAENNNA
ncbi:MAG: dockerin type I repeat-containing protein [Firmicutes bacterium]|nr:dockerin type I repeat-containing protein [Bacillota bacterium]